MRVYRVEAQDFLSYGKGFELDLPAGMLAITGHNGSGKSSLLDLITWVLFGRGRYNDIDAYVRQGATEARATVYLELGTARCRVTRTRTLRKKSGLQVQLLMDFAGPIWQAVELATIAEAEAYLQELLGVDYDALTATSFVLQGQAAAFTSATPAERKEILLRVLDVDRYGPLQVKAKALRDSTDRSIAVAQADVARLTAEAGERVLHQDRLAHDTASLHVTQDRVAKEEALLAGLEEAVAGAAASLAVVKEQALAVTAKRAGAAMLRQQIEDLRAAIAKRVVSDEDRAELAEAVERFAEVSTLASEGQAKRAQMMPLTQRLYDARRAVERAWADNLRRIEAVTHELEQANKQAGLIQDAGCDSPTQGGGCRFLAAAHDAVLRVQGLMAAREQALAATVDEAPVAALEAEIAAVGFDPERLSLAEALLKELQPAVAKAQKLGVLDAEREGLLATLRDKEAQLLEAEAAVAALPDPSDAVTVAMQGEKAARAERDEAKQTLRYSREEESTLVGAIARDEAALEHVKAAENALTVAEAQVASLGWERAGWAYLTQAYSRDGIPTMILKRAIPAIRSDANRLLEKMFGGRLWVDFVTETETKTSGKARDTFEVVVSDSLGSRPYAGWSGAERLAVDLAVRAALSRLLAARSGAAIRTFVMDEGAGALDPERMDAFVAAVRGLAQWFDSVLLVTHIPALRDQFAQRVEFEKGPAGSVARVEEVA